jgi:hypothetical protein
MRAFTAALFAAAASLVSAVVTPVGDPTGNPITSPGLGEIVPAGAPYTIVWTVSSLPLRSLGELGVNVSGL